MQKYWALKKSWGNTRHRMVQNGPMQNTWEKKQVEKRGVSEYLMEAGRYFVPYNWWRVLPLSAMCVLPQVEWHKKINGKSFISFPNFPGVYYKLKSIRKHVRMICSNVCMGVFCAPKSSASESEKWKSYGKNREIRILPFSQLLLMESLCNQHGIVLIQLFIVGLFQIENKLCSFRDFAVARFTPVARITPFPPTCEEA